MNITRDRRNRFVATQTARRPAPAKARVIARQPDPIEIDRPLEFMFNNGLVFELNRVIFHPIGLSMAVRPVDEKNPKKGLRLALFDCSENPTLTFDPPDFDRGQAKWKAWWKANGQANHSRREAMLGITTQVKADYREQTRNK